MTAPQGHRGQFQELGRYLDQSLPCECKSEARLCQLVPVGGQSEAPEAPQKAPQKTSGSVSSHSRASLPDAAAPTEIVAFGSGLG